MVSSIDFLELENRYIRSERDLCLGPRDISTYYDDDDPSEAEVQEEVAMQDKLPFVKEHNRQFKNQLSTVGCPVDHMWMEAAQVYAGTVQFELLKMCRGLRAS